MAATLTNGKKFAPKIINWGDLTWVDISEPTEEAKKYLAEKYKFHPMDLEDCFSRRQLSKVDEYENYLFIVFHFPVYDKIARVSITQQWSAFVGDKFLITLRPGILRAADDLRQECEVSEETRKEYFSQGAGYLMYSVIDRVVDSYFPVLDKILSLMDAVEDNVFDEEVEAAKEISILRRDIVAQRRVMFPTRTLLADVENKLKRFTKANLSVYFGDLMDHMNKICETLDECKEIIEVFKDADFTLSGYRANRTIRVLAITAAIGLPFLIITGIYSMNIGLPGGTNTSDPQTLAILLAIILVIVGGILYFFRRKRFI